MCVIFHISLRVDLVQVGFDCISRAVKENTMMMKFPFGLIQKHSMLDRERVQDTNQLGGTDQWGFTSKYIHHYLRSEGILFMLLCMCL